MNILDKIRHLFHRPLSCQRVNEFLADYLEGRLPPATREAFEAHVVLCPNCAVYFEQYRETVMAVRDAASVEPPEELVEATLNFLRKHLQEPGG